MGVWECGSVGVWTFPCTIVSTVWPDSPWTSTSLLMRPDSREMVGSWTSASVPCVKEYNMLTDVHIHREFTFNKLCIQQFKALHNVL